MDDEARIGLIRRGNELFNRQDFKGALKIFLATDYKDGIIRVAEHMYFEEGDIISGLKLYMKAGYRKMIDKVAEDAAYIIKTLLSEDKYAEEINKKLDEQMKAAEKLEEEHIKKWEPVVLSRDSLENMSDIENKSKQHK